MYSSNSSRECVIEPRLLRQLDELLQARILLSSFSKQMHGPYDEDSAEGGPYDEG